MTIMSDSKAVTYPYTALVLDGITYVPHYTEPELFVGPGFGRQHNNTRTAVQLRLRGARPVTEHLWKRAG